MTTILWRFVGLTSTIIGFLCYALSSSFTHLFGNWNILKIILYTLFSFIICLLILFASTWKQSRSLRFKAHSAFLVLTITSFYSFFSDKFISRKSDTYSLISYAAFALMSLSLSEQIQCGFEVDLMYFYLGCLIVQLMKINLSLAIVGVCYSYCLIIIRSSFLSLSVTQESQQCLRVEEQQVVIQVDSQQLENIKQQFLSCMNELKQSDSNIGKMILEEVKGNYKLVVTDYNFIIDAVSPETIDKLHEATKIMVDAGLETECYEVYISYRKEWLEDLLINKLLALRKMGFQDYVIGRWIKASKIALRIIFPSERQLFDRVFSESIDGDSSNVYFSRICSGAMMQLLNCFDSFANRNPSAWRLFKIMDLFETLCDLIRDIDSLCLDSLVNEAIKIKNSLGAKSRDIFLDFGNLIFLTPDADLDCWADGGVHPMTCEATGYIMVAFWSRKILEKILQEYPLVVDGTRLSSLFDSQMELIMEQFERKLEAKSQVYKDPSLRYFFIMNNLSHVEYKLETFWDNKLHKNIGRYFELYCESSWNKVIDILKMDVNESVAPISKAGLMKEKLSLFNRKFRETCEIQSTWRVFAEHLRKQIIVFIEIKLLTVYKNFIAMFQNVVGEIDDEYIVYEIIGIQHQLNNLFLLEDVDCVQGSIRKQLIRGSIRNQLVS